MADDVSGSGNSKNNDTQGEGETGAQTNSSGSVSTKNNWGADLTSLTVRHRRGNDASKQEEATYYNVKEGAEVGPLGIEYTTGFLSPEDYWWIKFVTNTGASFAIKSSFYCSISPSDDGQVALRIDGADKKMFVSFSASSGCDVSISQIPGLEEKGS